MVVSNEENKYKFVRKQPQSKRSFSGLGDVVAAITDLLGITKTEDCGCKKRQKLLNEKFPFKK